MDETTLTTTLRELAAQGALHPAPSADARARARRLQRRHRAVALTAVVVLAVGAFGVRDLAGGATRRSTTATAPAQVLTISQVKYQGQCAGQPMTAGELKSSDGVDCYLLEPAALTIRPKAAEAVFDSTQGWFVQVTLDDADQTAFGSLTAKVVSLEAPENQLAMVVDGKVLSAPTIQSTIDGGVFELSAGSDPSWTQAYAEQLAAQLRG